MRLDTVGGAGWICLIDDIVARFISSWKESVTTGDSCLMKGNSISQIGVASTGCSRRFLGMPAVFERKQIPAVDQDNRQYELILGNFTRSDNQAGL